MKKLILAISLFLIVCIISGCSLFGVENYNAFSLFLLPSDGTTIEQDGSIIVQSVSEEDTFNGVGLQLYSVDPVNYLEGIEWTSETGIYKGEYIHDLDTGTYIIRLKLNSKTADEYVDLRVHLLKGEKYMYTFNLKEFNERNARIENYLFALAQ